MSKQQIGISVAVVVAVVVVVYFLGGNFFSNTNVISNVPSQNGAQLVVQDEVAGTGRAAQPGDTVVVNYTGKLDNGTVFDTSVGRQPISFVLGSGQVIPGWDQGLVGMKEGGKRLLIIPPQLAYGSQDYGPIPANSTLTFEVELVSATPAASSSRIAPEGPAAE